VPAKPGEDAEAPEGEVHNLEGILRHLEFTADEVGDEGQVTVALVMETLGARSFGPLLLVPGLIGVSPIGAIPFIPAVMSAIVFLVSAQILIGMDYAWLPHTLLKRSMAGKRLRRVCSAVRPYVHYIDKLLVPRIAFLTHKPFLYVIAFLCLAVAAVTPILEVVPLLGIPPNAAIVAFGLAVTAHDGLWALIASIITAGSFYLLFAVI
jgi:hypothetical protein